MEKIAAVVLSVLVVVGIGFGWTNFNDEAARAEGGGAYVPPEPTAAPEAQRVVFIGDSYTSGAGSASSGGFVQVLSDRMGWAVENLGVGGTGYVVGTQQDPEKARLACGRNYCPNYPEQIDAAAAFTPDIVIVSGGRNNVGLPVDDLRDAISAFYRDLRAALPDADIWATSPLWDDDRPPAALAELSAEVELAVSAVDGRFLGIGQPLVGHPERVVDDGKHPNDAGHRAIARAIAQAGR